MLILSFTYRDFLKVCKFYRSLPDREHDLKQPLVKSLAHKDPGLADQVSKLREEQLFMLQLHARRHNARRLRCAAE